MITGLLNRCLIIIVFINSLNVFAQGLPATPLEINVPLDQFVNMPLEPDGFRRMFVWPSLSDRKVDIYFHENPPYIGTPTDIPMIPDEIKFYGGYFSISAYFGRQIFVSLSFRVPPTRPGGYPNNPGSYLDCMNEFGGHQYVYDGETVIVTGRAGIACTGRNNYYSFVKINKITIVTNATKPDIVVGNIDIPDSKRDLIDGLPIIEVGKEITINVPVSLLNGYLLLPSDLVNFIPVTLNIGSQSFLKYVSVSELNGNATKVVPFEVKLNPEDVGKKKISVSANMNAIVTEDNFTNNQAFQDVHVISGDELNLQISTLDINGIDSCDFTSMLDSTKCQTGKINDGDTLKIPFGSISKLTLVNSEGEIVPAKFELLSEGLAFASEIESHSLFPDRLAVLFNQDSEKNSQNLVTVHMGTQKLKITPVDTSIASITLILSSTDPINVGSTNATYDAIIISRAHKVGIPPQILKGQIAQESTEKFNPKAYRYEPRPCPGCR